jgi:uncharacterized protein YlaI
MATAVDLFIRIDSLLRKMPGRKRHCNVIPRERAENLARDQARATREEVLHLFICDGCRRRIALRRISLHRERTEQVPSSLAA